MKRVVLIAALVAASFNAQAEVWARGRNNAGGEIQLTNESCRDDSSYLRAYSYASNGTMLEGCWYLGENETMVRVVWTHTNGFRAAYETRFYPRSNFTLTDAIHRRNTRSY